MITERDIQVLSALHRYYLLCRSQIQRLCFPTDRTGRVTRRRLQELCRRSLVNRQRVIVDHPHIQPPGSVYYPAQRGRELLSEYLDDPQLRLIPTQRPQSDHVLHWLAVSETHITLDAAIGRQDAVSIEGWINEFDIVNPAESDPAKRFRLYTLIRESPRLISAPDAAFVLKLGPHSKIFYLEQDRGTSGAVQVAARKSPGYVALAEKGLQRRHFPSATIDAFSVLAVAPNHRRRDALRREMNGRPGDSLWKFASATDLTAESFLHAPVFWSCADEQPRSLVQSSPDRSE